MSREDPQLKIRLPLELKEKITQSAADYGRSINSEVVARLEESFTIVQDAKDSQQRLVDSTLELQSAFKANLDLQNKLIEVNKSLTDEIQQLKKQLSNWVPLPLTLNLRVNTRIWALLPDPQVECLDMMLKSENHDLQILTSNSANLQSTSHIWEARNQANPIPYFPKFSTK